ncbi:MAG: protease modulator HflK [Oligoflexia bacterium]|nr:protease modulator HflK [Oligoflexia bacterium]
MLFRTDLLDFRAPTASLADGIAATFCLCGALLVATAARFLADTEPSWLPEGPSLSRGARVLAWILVLASLSIGLSLEKLDTLFKVTHFALLALNTAICWSLLTASWPSRESASIFPLNFGVLQVFGSRTNIVGSVLDSAEKQLGIDLRSTWALNVVRRALEPLALGLLLIGWISTSFSVVGVQEQGLVERLGIPVGGEPLAPGLHLHWPWPIDKVYRIAMLRVQAVQVGHEGEEEGGPENVIWAVEHAPNEYALLLGNGRDLITVDATVQYRITDARAWRYHAQNPEEALKAISYRAVMRSTVNLTLSEALSQNLTALTAKMREMVQKDATALGLGVDIVAFTVGGMHPPVPVAADYEAVVSAELGKVTSVVNAQAARNRSVPAARASVVEDENKARAEGAQVLAVAAGEAWSFRTLESQYKASPGEYFFRRRLETLEAGLAKRRFTILDSRFERDGGEIWLQQ